MAMSSTMPTAISSTAAQSLQQPRSPGRSTSARRARWESSHRALRWLFANNAFQAARELDRLDEEDGGDMISLLVMVGNRPSGCWGVARPARK